MKIVFKINYKTQWGQRIFVSGSTPELGNWDEAKALALNALPNDNWEIALDIPNKSNAVISYKYFVLNEHSGSKTWEWGTNRELTVPAKLYEYIEIIDNWNSSTDPQNALFSAAFTKSIFKREPSKVVEETNPPQNGLIYRFKIEMPRISAKHKICITGSDEALGGWNKDKPLILECEKFPLWQADVFIENITTPIYYKYGIYNTETENIDTYEEGGNRVLHFSKSEGFTQLTAITETKFRFPVGNWKATGVAIPVFALRSENGMGVGEFLDLKKMVDWAKKTGMKMIQILPINDTIATQTWIDSYPYSGISVYALHPMFANLQAMGELSSPLTQSIINEQRTILNNKSGLDYEAVMRTKSRFFKMIYDETKDKVFAEPAFQAYFEENASWLKPYASFSYLRDLYNTPIYERWGKYAVCSPEIIEEITDPNAPQYDDIAVHYFIQYHLHKQLLEVTEYARQNQVVLKGDIPIGIFRRSVDAWVSPEFYNLDSQAGAPPDDFTLAGQNWKLPTYNWGNMEKDGYSWWRSRLTHTSKYFDAYRIDHILGFFRIWEIPIQHVEGIMGHFNPAMPFHRDELSARGIWFDYERYCSPYIRDYTLWEIFGEEAEYVKHTFLEEYAHNCFRFKEAFDTQRKIENHFATDVDTPADTRAYYQRMKERLFQLHTDVIFLEAPFSDKTAFNPRHTFQRTYSYQALDDHTKGTLDALYIEYFYKRHEAFWKDQAMQKLPVIVKATDMLVCGEDLGMVPDCVPPTMEELGLLSLNIQRMPKDPKVTFGHPADYPYLSVASTSSHDMSPLRGWWEEADKSKIQRFFNEILGNGGGAPYFCEDWVVRQIVVQHLYSPAMWAVFPLQDLLGMSTKLRRPDAKAEQINNPANPQHYWRYRMHLTLEQLLQEDEFNSTLLKLNEESGRSTAY
jgi:4-alpha-glucanotransferase